MLLSQDAHKSTRQPRTRQPDKVSPALVWWNQVVISLEIAFHRRLGEVTTDNKSKMNECTMISMLMFPSALFLYISTLLLSPYPFYYGQPFGISLSSLHTRKLCWHLLVQRSRDYIPSPRSTGHRMRYSQISTFRICREDYHLAESQTALKDGGYLVISDHIAPVALGKSKVSQPEVAPYGTWESPILPEDFAHGPVILDQV
jgi:hypothetical protein